MQLWFPVGIIPTELTASNACSESPESVRRENKVMAELSQFYWQNVNIIFYTVRMLVRY